MQPVKVNTFGAVKVPIWLEKVATAVIFIGERAGCGTNNITDFLTTKFAKAVPATPLASVYVTVTGIVIVKLTFA